MEELEKEIKTHQNNIKIYIEEQNKTKNIKKIETLNDDILKETNFIKSLINIKQKIEIDTNKKDINQKSTQKVEDNDILNTEKKLNSEISEQAKNITNKKNITQKDKKKYKKRSKTQQKKNYINVNILVENLEDNYKTFEYYFADIDILSKFIKKSQSKNFIYYTCSKKRNGCIGYIKYNKKEKKFYLLESCLEQITHDTLKFNTFYENYTNKNLSCYNMNLKKIQKFFVRAIYKTNEANDINNIKTIFKNKFNIRLNLTNDELYKEKHLALGTLYNLDILDLCKKIIIKFSLIPPRVRRRIIFRREGN